MEGPTKVKTSRNRTLRSGDGVPVVEVLEGERSGERIALDGAQTLVGRASEAALRFIDDGVSREHAKFVLADDGIVNLVDLGSTNGTFVNGTRIDVAVVREGDRVQFGPDVTVRFGYGPTVVDAKPAAADEPRFELSPREFEVAQLVCEGLTNAEIGARLHISPYTVMTHLSNIYGRIEIKSRAVLAKLMTAGRLYSR